MPRKRTSLSPGQRETLKRNLKSFRAELGAHVQRELTQQDVATMADLSVFSVSRYERGGGRPAMDEAMRLAAIYGRSVEDLFSEKPAPFSEEKFRIASPKQVHARKVTIEIGDYTVDIAPRPGQAIRPTEEQFGRLRAAMQQLDRVFDEAGEIRDEAAFDAGLRAFIAAAREFKKQAGIPASPPADMIGLSELKDNLEPTPRSKTMRSELKDQLASGEIQRRAVEAQERRRDERPVHPRSPAKPSSRNRGRHSE